MVMSLKGNNHDIFVILVTHSFKNISPYSSATFKVTFIIKLFFAIKYSFCYQKKKLMFCSKINLFKDKSLFLQNVQISKYLKITIHITGVSYTLVSSFQS